MDLSTTLKTALPLVRDKAKHKHYDHVVELAAKYYRPLVTGHGAEHLIQRFNLREDEDAYKQRLRLTQITTPSICNTLMGPLRKVPKVKPTVDRIHFMKDDEKREKELRDAMSRFWAGRSVDAYLGSILLDQGAIDPNAFCLVLFDEFDERYEKPTIYPSLVSSEDAWNYEFANGELRWLLVHRSIKYETTVTRKGKVPAGQQKTKAVTADGDAFWMYGPNFQVMFVQKSKDTLPSLVEGIVVSKDGTPLGEGQTPTLSARDTYYYRPDAETLYEVSFYEHKGGVVQAFRLGYVPDHSTRGETMVSFLEPSRPYLMKGLKAGSELDLSAALHAFLQKLQYTNPCKGFREHDGNTVPCNKGVDPSGNTCKACSGSGYDTHRSGQDHITFSLPRTKEEFLDLEQLVRYVALPVEVLQWQDGYVTKLEQACYRSVYNSDRFRQNDVAATATGDIIDLQSVYDALRPAADWYSYSRVKVYRLACSFILGSDAAKDVTIHHEFPRNMRFETLAERVRLLKELREAGASLASIAQVNSDMLRDLYVDDPESLKKALVQASFDPFLGKSEGTIVSMVSQDLCPKEAKVLWTNWNYVFAQAEQAVPEGQSFYDLARPRQEAIVSKVVADLIEKMEADAQARAERAGFGVDDTEDTEGDTDTTDADEATDGDEEQQETGDDMPDSPGNRATS